jgi:hypothetical protein
VIENSTDEVTTEMIQDQHQKKLRALLADTRLQEISKRILRKHHLHRHSVEL